MRTINLTKIQIETLRRAVDRDNECWQPRDKKRLISALIRAKADPLSEEDFRNIEKQKIFIETIIILSKAFNLSIGHEDFNGGFIIEPYRERNSKWLKKAVLEDWE